VAEAARSWLREAQGRDLGDMDYSMDYSAVIALITGTDASLLSATAR
jgi:hypothetical protein